MACLDESINGPSWTCAPYKPHSYRNKYHSIADADGDDGAPMTNCYRLHEGKDMTYQLGKAEIDTL